MEQQFAAMAKEGIEREMIFFRTRFGQEHEPQEFAGFAHKVSALATG